MPTVTSHAMRFRRGTQRLLSRTHMTINPEIALAYLRELSADYRAGIVLNTHGERLAGDERLTAAARALVAANARAESETGAQEENGAGGAARVFEGSVNAG